MSAAMPHSIALSARGAACATGAINSPARTAATSFFTSLFGCGARLPGSRASHSYFALPVPLVDGLVAVSLEGAVRGEALPGPAVVPVVAPRPDLVGGQLAVVVLVQAAEVQAAPRSRFFARHEATAVGVEAVISACRAGGSGGRPERLGQESSCRRPPRPAPRAARQRLRRPQRQSTSWVSSQ